MHLFPSLASLPLLAAVAGLPLAEGRPGWVQGRAVPTPGKDGAVQRLTFSPDGRRLITVQQRNITLWDLPSRKPVATIEDVNVVAWYHSCGFTSDGRAWFLTRRKVEREGVAEIALVDLETRRTRTVFSVLQPWAIPALSPDGRYLACVSFDEAHYNRVLLHSVATGQRIVIMPGTYSGPIRSLTFSPDSRSLVAGHGYSYRYNDGRLTVWDVATRKKRFALREPRGAEPVVVSGNNKAVAWGRHDGGVSVADLATGRVRLRLENASGKLPLPFPLALSSDGNQLATVCGEGRSRLVIRRLSEPVEEVAVPLADARGVTALALSPDGRVLLAGQEDGKLLMFNASRRKGETRPTRVGHCPRVARYFARTS
jgi:WD40 repeat protein